MIKRKIGCLTIGLSGVLNLRSSTIRPRGSSVLRE
jgi:hypothetical protein